MEAIIIAKCEFDKIIDKLDSIVAELNKHRDVNPISEKWLTNKQVCELLSVSSRTLQRYRDEGRIAFSQIGATIRYKASDVELFLRSNYNPMFNTNNSRL